jgi:hypothetical protein
VVVVFVNWLGGGGGGVSMGVTGNLFVAIVGGVCVGVGGGGGVILFYIATCFI